MSQISDIVEDVCKQMCDSYCKYTSGNENISDEKLDEICGNCPLNKL